jgi:hypothetical protein
MGGPRGTTPEYFVATEEGVSVLNQNASVTATNEAIRLFFGKGF